MPRSRYTSPVHASARFVAQRMVLKPLVWSLASVTVRGRERVEGLERPYVVVSNHSSHLDAPLVMGAWPRKDGRYLAANAAADYFFDVAWRKALTSLFFNAFPVDRTGLRGRGGMATKLLDDRIPLLIFPEGTRSKDGELGRFTPGAAALCVSRGVPCVPVALVGAYEAMPKGTNWPRRGRPPVTVNIGEPLTPQPGESVLQFSDRVVAAIRALSAEIDKPATRLTRRQLRGKARGVKRGVNGSRGGELTRDAAEVGRLHAAPGLAGAAHPTTSANGSPRNGAATNGAAATGAGPNGAAADKSGTNGKPGPNGHGQFGAAQRPIQPTVEPAGAQRDQQHDHRHRNQPATSEQKEDA